MHDKDDSAKKVEAVFGCAKSEMIDLTAEITAETTVYPGDPKFSMQALATLHEAGSHFNLSQLKLSNHLGTHIDFPAHVIAGGKSSSDYPLEYLCGECLIVDVPQVKRSIDAEFIRALPIEKNQIVFFKTANSNLPKQGAFISDYVYMEPDAAIELVCKQPRIVGVDYISIDAADAEMLPVHHTLLEKDILIVEGLQLKSAPIGVCQVFIAPLNVPHLDGQPARVFALKCH